MRVSELAKELGKTSKEVLDVLQKNNQDVSSHSSNVNEAQIGMVKKALIAVADAVGERTVVHADADGCMMLLADVEERHSCT